MRIFVDSSILLAFLTGQDGGAYRVLEDIEDGIATGYINPIVVDETIYGYLRLTTGLSSRRIRQLLAKRSGRIAGLIRSDVLPVLKLFVSLPLSAEPDDVVSLIEEYGLMPADALIALTCKQHGIGTVATLDDDFKRIPWLRTVP